MPSILGASPKRRQQMILLSALLLALFITFFFGMRAFRRFSRPPSDELIREWMSIPYIAHAYHVPPPVLVEALGLPTDARPSRRPLDRIAKELNLTTTEVITRLEEAIAQARASRAPPGEPPKKSPLDESQPLPAPTPTR